MQKALERLKVYRPSLLFYLFRKLLYSRPLDSGIVSCVFEVALHAGRRKDFVPELQNKH